jgi:hypothetical protein
MLRRLKRSKNEVVAPKEEEEEEEEKGLGFSYQVFHQCSVLIHWGWYNCTTGSNSKAKVSLTAACKTRIVSWKGLACA